MNKERLQKRIEELDVAMRQITANFNALEGAKQECNNWLQIIESEETAKKLGGEFGEAVCFAPICPLSPPLSPD